MAHLATVSAVPQVGSFPINECADLVLASWSRVSCFAILLFAGTHVGCTVLFTACLFGTDGSPRPSLKFIWKLPSALIVA